MILRDTFAARGVALVVWVAAVAACHPTGAAYPWGAQVPPLSEGHAEVHTRNQNYDRLHSRVLVREVDRATRANLDYAAYHANFMILEEAPESAASSSSGASRVADPFAGTLEAATLTADITSTQLTAQERAAPLAFAPMLELALARKVAGTEVLETVATAVRSETWGQPPRPGTAYQAVTEAFVHRLASGGSELWVKIEFAPWFKALGTVPDQDRDGVTELYARVRATPLHPELARWIETDYGGRVLDRAEVLTWANQLASYWYPSFNTDLVPPPVSWPDSSVESDIRVELRGETFKAPSIVVRGKPQGRATYEVFLVHTQSGAAPAPNPSGGGTLALPKTRPTPQPELLAERIRAELAAFGQAGWPAWNERLSPFHTAVRKKLATQPRTVKALAGVEGFLFFRTSLEAVVGGEIEAQPAGKNPLPIILEFKDALAAHGVDFLFVPVPSKIELFPDALDPASKALAGQIVHPQLRKFLLSLSEHGVEVLDLLTPLLAARAAGDAGGQEPLYQHQDTHWTDRGLRLAADVLRDRIERYPWYTSLASHAQTFGVKDTEFTRFGDLHERLPEPLKKKYRPETLRAQQVVRADGSLYEDDPDSPITILGDSFTGVYELTDAEHAGLSAHVARGISYPVDLVMSYGGGPNVRNKLMRRGAAALDHKKLVIWVMAARDLYNYWEDWQPLQQP